LEYPTTTSLLPLERISKFFRFAYLTPSRLYKYKFSLNKVQGRLGFLPENQVSLGATTGGIPPIKWSHFSQKTAFAPSTSRSELRANSRGTRAAKRRRCASRDSPRLQQDTALPPHHFTYKPFLRTNLPSQNLPKQKKKDEIARSSKYKQALKLRNIQMFLVNCAYYMSRMAHVLTKT
jgi:hypothetical protein